MESLDWHKVEPVPCGGIIFPAKSEKLCGSIVLTSRKFWQPTTARRNKPKNPKREKEKIRMCGFNALRTKNNMSNLLSATTNRSNDRTRSTRIAGKYEMLKNGIANTMVTA